MSKSILMGILMFSTCLVSAQSIFGKWRTIDDRTGEPKAVIAIYEKDGFMYGDIVDIVEKGKENFICTKCKGPLKDKPAIGMTIIDAAVKGDNGVWKGKTLFDPQKAMTFRCKIWLNPENPSELKVRGYLAFIYRTQTWIRVKG